MKASVFYFCQVIYLTSLVRADQHSHVRQRQIQSGTVDSRPVPLVVGDKFSTMIDATELSAIPGAPSDDGTSMTYSIMFREGASYTTVHFKEFNLGERCTMQVRGKDLPDGTKQAYKMAGKGKMNLGENFWTQHVKGDTMTLDVRCAKDVQANAHFVIDEVAVGFVENGPGQNASGESVCGTTDYENVQCYSDTIQYTKARALARLLIRGNSFCTGWLVNSEGHLLTNQHCLTSASDAINTDFEFGAEAPSCTSNNCQNCYPGSVISGATYIQDNYELDYCLVQFTDSTPQSIFGYLELDDRAAVLGEKIYIPQHPGGRAKTLGIISTHDQNPEGFCKMDSITESGCTGAPFDYGYYCDTEGGSSGSPVLSTASNKVIALHHCRGSDPCSQSGSGPNRAVPITFILDQIGSLIGGPGPTGNPTTPTPMPIAVPTQSPTMFSCPAGEEKFILDLSTDRFGSETTWKVVNDCNGETVLFNGPYSQGFVTQYLEQYCLSSGPSYTFTIFDSFGDGLCCSYGSGLYRISYGGSLVATSYSFQYSSSHSFGGTCSPSGSATPTPVPTSFPSPSPVFVPAPSSLPTPFPSPSPVLAPKPSGPFYECFSKVATVIVENQGPKNMTNLRIGDKVLTSNGYQPIYAFAHQDDQTQAEFLQIHTSQHSSNPLEITSQHMVFLVGKSTAVPAYTVRHGDLLQSSGFPTGAQVQKVTSVKRSGLYAPLTRDGTVVVDGILASCYVAAQKNSEGYVELQGGVSTGLSQHFFSHLTMTPVRLACIGLSNDLCKFYDPDGLAYFAKIGLSTAQTADNWRLLIQLVLLPVYLACVGSLYALECIFGSRFAVLVLVGAILATLRWQASLAAIRDEVKKEK